MRTKIDLLFYFVLIWGGKFDLAMGQATSGPVGPPANQTTTTMTTTRLKIAVPVKLGFTGFVKVSDDPTNGDVDFSGFSIDVFKTVASAVHPKPIVFDFIPFAKPDGTMNGTYDDMLKAVHSKEYDGAVGDITIRFYRRGWVEFSTPYTDSGVAMLIPLRQPSSKTTTKKAAGISLLPLIKALLISTLVVFVFTALAFSILDYFKKNGGQAQGAGARARNEEDRLKETLIAIRDTRMVIVLWFVVLLLLITCYVASLASLLTTEKVRVPSRTLNQLLRNGDNVGYPRSSFVLNYLTQKGFSENKLVPFDSEKDMQDLLSKGTANGGVAAVIHETPYLQVFLAQHCDEFALVPNFNIHAAGFGFAFQIDSPWVQPVSDGILKLLDNGQLAKIQDRTVGSLASCQGDSSGGAGSNLTDSSTPGIVIAGIACSLFILVILYAVFIIAKCKNTRQRGANP